MLRKATKPFLKPERSPLDDVMGVARLLLRRGKKEEMEDMYVVHHLHTHQHVHLWSARLIADRGHRGALRCGVPY